MFDLYTTTHADISPAHVTDGALVKKLLAKLAERRREAIMRELGAKAKPSCKTCYGRGYAGIQGDAVVVCPCTKR